jgi:hypothetical protein
MINNALLFMRRIPNRLQETLALPLKRLAQHQPHIRYIAV